MPSFKLMSLTLMPFIMLCLLPKHKYIQDGSVKAAIFLTFIDSVRHQYCVRIVFKAKLKAPANNANGSQSLDLAITQSIFL